MRCTLANVSGSSEQRQNANICSVFLLTHALPERIKEGAWASRKHDGFSHNVVNLGGCRQGRFTRGDSAVGQAPVRRPRGIPWHGGHRSGVVRIPWRGTNQALIPWCNL